MSNKLDLKRQREIIECEYQLESEEQSEQSMPPKQYNIQHIIPKAFMDVCVHVHSLDLYNFIFILQLYFSKVVQIIIKNLRSQR